MASLIYALCALTACLCAWLLWRSYRHSRYRLLLWGSLCFMGLTVNNMLVMVDKVTGTNIDLSLWRLGVALASLIVLLYGLIAETE